MSIKQTSQTLTTKLLPEYSSRVVLLTRDEIDNGNGSCSTKFGAVVHPTLTIFEVDDNDKPTAIYEAENLDSFQMSAEQFGVLFTIQMILADGTMTNMAELLSNLTDQFIAQQLNVQGIITTQNINLASVLAAQANNGAAFQAGAASIAAAIVAAQEAAAAQALAAQNAALAAAAAQTPPDTTTISTSSSIS